MSPDGTRNATAKVKVRLFCDGKKLPIPTPQPLVLLTSPPDQRRMTACAGRRYGIRALSKLFIPTMRACGGSNLQLLPLYIRFTCYTLHLK